MAVILRFVNDEGKEMERLLGLQHVESCTVVALKEAFVSMLNSHKLPICRLRGQCYDGASNMRDCLSHALQRKDQDIIEARHLIIDVKEQLQDMRDNGWDPLFKRAKEFCDKMIEAPDMEKKINARGTSAHRKQNVTNMHFYHVEVFLAAIDAILSEMNHRFGEVSSELLVCMACLNPRNSFSNFDVDKLVRLAQIY
uniref:DUF4371 domain-containing protein n=1 Tax=Oryza brachyantha TaxID=4533 RepID=J3M5D5_ORYBR